MGSFKNLKRHEGDNNRVKEVAGNCNEKQCCREKDSFQVDLRMECRKDAIYKDEERMTNIQTLWISCKMDIVRLTKEGMSIRSAKHRGAQSQKWQHRINTYKAKHTEQFKDHRA